MIHSKRTLNHTQPMKLNHNWQIGDLFYYGEVFRIWWPDKTKIPIPFKIVAKDEDLGNLETISLEGEISSITTDTDLQHMRPCPINEAKEFAKNLLKNRQERVLSTKDGTSKALAEAAQWKIDCTKKLLPELGFVIE